MTAGTQPFQIKLSSLLIWGLGLFWMLAMLSADFRDPTFFNPLYPSEGLHNWLSLPGALLGGSMIEIFKAPQPLHNRTCITSLGITDCGTIESFCGDIFELMVLNVF